MGGRFACAYRSAAQLSPPWGGARLTYASSKTGFSGQTPGIGKSQICALPAAGALGIVDANATLNVRDVKR